MSGKEILSESVIKKFNDIYKNLELPNCPKCGDNKSVIPSVQGKPTKELYLYSELGHVKLSGCCHGYKGWCNKCQEFIQ